MKRVRRLRRCRRRRSGACRRRGAARRPPRRLRAAVAPALRPPGASASAGRGGPRRGALVLVLVLAPRRAGRPLLGQPQPCAGRLGLAPRTVGRCWSTAPLWCGQRPVDATVPVQPPTERCAEYERAMRPVAPPQPPRSRGWRMLTPHRPWSGRGLRSHEAYAGRCEPAAPSPRLPQLASRDLRQNKGRRVVVGVVVPQ